MGRSSVLTLSVLVVLFAALRARGEIWEDPAYEKLAKAVELFNAKELDAAEKLVGESLALYESNILAHYLLGEIHLEKEQWAAALKDYARTTELYPNFAEGHRKTGVALASMKEYGKGAAAFQKALSLNGDDTEALKGLALCTGELGNTELAIQYY
ncbi:unnamed protein product, partial [marine sediment metagenome]